MSVETDPLPPPPQNTPPVREDAQTPNNINKRFAQDWNQWFVQLRSKVNVLNSQLIQLSQVVTGGIIGSDGDGNIVSRTIEGTSGRIEVTNGDGVAGNPTIDLIATGVTPGTYGDSSNVPVFTVDEYGRVLSITTVPVSGGGGGTGYPNYLELVTTSEGTLVTSHVINLPSTVNAGDKLILQFATGAAITPSAPAGWTTVYAANRALVAELIATGSEGGTTVIVTTSSAQRSASVVHRIQAGTFDVATISEVSNSTGSNATPAPPPLTPSWGVANTLWLAGFSAQNNGSVLSFPFLNGNIHVRSSGSTGTAYAETASCFTTQALATMTPSTYSKSLANVWVAYTIGVRPV